MLLIDLIVVCQWDSVPLMAYFHCRTQIQIRTQTQIPNPMTTEYYGEHVSTDSDSDRDPSDLNPSPAMEISHYNQ